MLTILMVCDFYAPGLSYQENMLEKYYRKDGHRVVVVTSRHESIFGFVGDRRAEGPTGLVHDLPDFRLYRQPYSFNLLNRIRSLSGLPEILDAERPDLMFMHDISPNLIDLARYRAAHPDVPLLLDYHADYSNSGRGWLSRRVLHGVVRKSILYRARQHISRILPVVPESAAFLNEVYGVAEHDMELFPLGFDVDAVDEARNGSARADLRGAYGIGADDVVVFSGGKLDSLKRTDVLIEAFADVANPSLHLVLAGDDAPGGTAFGQNLLARAREVPNVILTGWLPSEQLYAHMAMADFAVFPASQSVLWQQCIGMGLPLVLGRRVSTTRRLQDVDYLNGRKNIIVLDPAKPLRAELTNAITRLGGDRALRQSMGAGARDVAENLLRWDRLARFTLSGAGVELG
jgi:glycosyltransferase involved in cell wall biosynthesis